MSDLKTYKGNYRKGYLPEQGTEYWSEKQWQDWKAFVDRCIADGTYGQEQEVEITLKHNPIFDGPINKVFGEKGMESYKMVMLDISK